MNDRRNYIGREVMRSTGRYDHIHGRIIGASPRTTTFIVRWETGKTGKIHHKKLAEYL